jgi:CRP-like cAMP-binding protein
MSILGGKRPAERTRDKLSLLRNHSLFRDLPPAVIEHLGSYMKTRRVARGNTIFAKGDPGTGLMGVLAGTVKVSVASAEGKDIVLNLFHEGEVFGEIALLDGRPRTADAIAMSDCELVVIERRDFVPFLSSHPDVMLKFIEILCSRLRRTSEQVQDITTLLFAPKANMRKPPSICPLCAISGCEQSRQGSRLFDHLVGAREQGDGRTADLPCNRARRVGRLGL